MIVVTKHKSMDGARRYKRYLKQQSVAQEGLSLQNASMNNAITFISL
jgi:hypothetical protein